jgi:hypothetical protein
MAEPARPVGDGRLVTQTSRGDAEPFETALGIEESVALTKVPLDEVTVNDRL